MTGLPARARWQPRLPALARASLLLQGCVSRDEVARVRSPGGDIDALVVERNGGATTGFVYEVHLVPAGGKRGLTTEVAVLQEAIRNDRAGGVNARWRSPDLLAVEFLTARRSDLSNAHVRVASREVTVYLCPGVDDPTAPPGGMLYNLQGRPGDNQQPWRFRLNP